VTRQHGVGISNIFESDPFLPINGNLVLVLMPPIRLPLRRRLLDELDDVDRSFKRARLSKYLQEQQDVSIEPFIAPASDIKSDISDLSSVSSLSSLSNLSNLSSISSLSSLSSISSISSISSLSTISSLDSDDKTVTSFQPTPSLSLSDIKEMYALIQDGYILMQDGIDELRHEILDLCKNPAITKTTQIRLLEVLEHWRNHAAQQASALAALAAFTNAEAGPSSTTLDGDVRMPTTYADDAREGDVRLNYEDNQDEDESDEMGPA
jgi:hypothetical protein